VNAVKIVSCGMAGPIIPTSDNVAGPRHRLLPRVFEKCLCRSGIDEVMGPGWCSDGLIPTADPGAT
jgi:hypothetical protein